MPLDLFIEKAKRILGLLVSAAAFLFLLISFHNQPTILAARAGIVCAVLCSLALFILMLIDGSVSDITMIAAPVNQKLAVIVGVPISLFADASILYFADKQPDLWLLEIGSICGLVCSILLFLPCWAALWTALVVSIFRKLGWSQEPQKARSMLRWVFLASLIVILPAYRFWPAPRLLDIDMLIALGCVNAANEIRRALGIYQN